MSLLYPAQFLEECSAFRAASIKRSSIHPVGSQATISATATNLSFQVSSISRPFVVGSCIIPRSECLDRERSSLAMATNATLAALRFALRALFCGRDPRSRVRRSAESTGLVAAAHRALALVHLLQIVLGRLGGGGRCRLYVVRLAMSALVVELPRLLRK